MSETGRAGYRHRRRIDRGRVRRGTADRRSRDRRALSELDAVRVGELVVLPGGFDVAEGPQERAVGIGGGSSTEAMGDAGDLDRGVDGVDVAEVDPGQLLPVE